MKKMWAARFWLSTGRAAVTANTKNIIPAILKINLFILLFYLIE